MAKVEHGSYTAWLVNGTPRYMKDGKMLSGKNLDPQMKQELDALLIAATPANAPEAPAVALTEEGPKPTLNPGLGEAPFESVQGTDDVEMLKQQVQELMKMVQAQQYTQNQNAAPQVTSNGVIGTYEKYSTDPKYYANPVEKLRKEPKLRQFAFSENYELLYKVIPQRYQTVNGNWQSEPQFYIELNRVVFDEETGEPTNTRYTISKLYLTEDPDTAVHMANELGLPVDESNERQFLDDMRYIRFRDWLFEQFYAPKSTAKKDRREVVVGNRLVEMFEISGENPQTMPFSDLNSKVG